MYIWVRDTTLIPWSTCGDMLSQNMTGVSKKEMEHWFNKQSINVLMSIHPDPGFVPMRRFPKDENGLVLRTASMEQFALNSHSLVLSMFLDITKGQHHNG